MESYTHRVKYYETDRMGVTHHSNYIRFMEEARVEFLRGIGLDYARMEELGIVSPVVEVSCSFKKTTTFDDVISIAIRAEEFTGVRLWLSYRMVNGEGAVVAEARSCHCFLDAAGRPVRLKRDYPDIYEILMRQTKAAEGQS